MEWAIQTNSWILQNLNRCTKFFGILQNTEYLQPAIYLQFTNDIKVFRSLKLPKLLVFSGFSTSLHDLNMHKICSEFFRKPNTFKLQFLICLLMIPRHFEAKSNPNSLRLLWTANVWYLMFSSKYSSIDECFLGSL